MSKKKNYAEVHIVSCVGNVSSIDKCIQFFEITNMDKASFAKNKAKF